MSLLRLITAIAALCLLSAPALYAGEVDVAFGNTIKVVDAKGRATLCYMDPDGAYRARNPDGSTVTGRWFAKDGQICIEVETLAGPRSVCGEPLTTRKVGGRWAFTDDRVGAIEVSILQGRDAKEAVPR